MTAGGKRTKSSVIVREYFLADMTFNQRPDGEGTSLRTQWRKSPPVEEITGAKDLRQQRGPGAGRRFEGLECGVGGQGEQKKEAGARFQGHWHL